MGKQFVGRDYAKMRSRINRSSERSFSSRQGAVKALIIFSCGVRLSSVVNFCNRLAKRDNNFVKQ